MGDKDKKNLTRLSKREILKIMVAQGEEIDKLNARVAELETELAERHVAMDRVGSLAEASQAVAVDTEHNEHTDRCSGGNSAHSGFVPADTEDIWSVDEQHADVG